MIRRVRVNRSALAAAVAGVVALIVVVALGTWLLTRSHEHAAPRFSVPPVHRVTTPPAATPSFTNGTRPRVSDCGLVKPTARPTSITLTCADANELLQHVRWNYWGPDMGAGVAVLTENTCTPSCADGFYDHQDASVLVDLPKATAEGAQFTRLTVVTGGGRQHATVWQLATYPTGS